MVKGDTFRPGEGNPYTHISLAEVCSCARNHKWPGFTLDRQFSRAYGRNVEKDSCKARRLPECQATERLTATARTKWQRVRSKGRARFIRRSFLSWGLPMWAAQYLGQFLYATLSHQPYTPFQIFSSPVLSFIFDLVFWIFGFGYLIGESMWQKQERESFGIETTSWLHYRKGCTAVFTNPGWSQGFRDQGFGCAGDSEAGCSGDMNLRAMFMPARSICN